MSPSESALRAMLRMFSSGDLAEAPNVIAERYVDHQGLDGEPLHGVDGFARVVAAARSAAPDLRVEIDDVVADVNLVAARLRWTGGAAERQTLELVRVVAGRAVEHWGATLERSRPPAPVP